MEGQKMNVRQELDALWECLCAAEDGLNRALEAVNGRELAEACEGKEGCGVSRREPGILDRLELAVKRASAVAGKAAELAAQL